MSKQGKYLDIFLLFAKWRISLFCGLWDREQNLDREIVLVAVCGYCVQSQEVAASEEGRLTQASDWSMVRMEASHWSPGRVDYPGDSGCGGSRPQRPSWWRKMIILSLSITGASHFRHPDPDTGARQMTSNTELWLVNADHVTWILSSDWFTGARQMTTWTRLSNSSPALTLCCYQHEIKIEGRQNFWKTLFLSRFVGPSPGSLVINTLRQLKDNLGRYRRYFFSFLTPILSRLGQTSSNFQQQRPDILMQPRLLTGSFLLMVRKFLLITLKI